MKSSKKSVVGPVVLRMLLSGESEMADTDLSARIVAFYLLVMLRRCVIRTVLSGLENGF